MKNERYLIVSLLLLCVLSAEARKQHIINLSRDYQSVTVNEDSTVNFCYCGNARQVYVQSDLYYADEDSTRYTDLRTRRIKMHRQSDGCFHVTTKAIQPEMYTYCFNVNGKRRTDHLNNDTAWQMAHKWNIVTVGGSQQVALYEQPAQQGTLLHTCWYSSEEKICRRVNIYLPASYETSTDSFPTLYLLHGLSGYEGSWNERGRAVQILENLVAQGKCRPMLLVMPDVNVDPKEYKPTHRSLFTNVMNYSRLCHDRNIERALVELTALVDSTFRVSNEHYIAGLSDGARMAANSANMLPDYFAAVGLFSPVVHKQQLPGAASAEKDYQRPNYLIYTGKKDMFHGNAKTFHKYMDKAQIPHEYTETIGGHTWRNWRLYLSDFITKIAP